jgi:hypothetical protein
MKKQTVYIIVIVVIVLIIGGYLLYRAGKKNATPPQVKYPNGGNGIPPDWSPVPLIEQLHDVMNGLFTLSGTKDAAWITLRDLGSDDMVTAVYNGFNQRYFKEDKGTLTQWIRDEKWIDWTSGVKDSTLARLSKLNLA